MSDLEHNRREDGRYDRISSLAIGDIVFYVDFNECSITETEVTHVEDISYHGSELYVAYLENISGHRNTTTTLFWSESAARKALKEAISEKIKSNKIRLSKAIQEHRKERERLEKILKSL